MSSSQDAFAELSALSLKPGDIIEILWKITPEHAGPDEEKWWPAKLVADGQTQPQRDAEGRAVWKLMYEAFEDFDAEERMVVFLAEHDLYDVDGEEDMLWRKQGDKWEAPLATVEQTYSAAEVARMADAELSYISGGQSDEEMMRSVQSVIPPEKLLQGASGMRDFMDKFKEHMQNAAASSGKENGEGLVVTKDMIDEFAQSLKRGA